MDKIQKIRVWRDRYIPVRINTPGVHRIRVGAVHWMPQGHDPVYQVQRYSYEGDGVEQIPFSSLRKGDRFDLMLDSVLQYQEATYGLLAVEDPDGGYIAVEIEVE